MRVLPLMADSVDANRQVKAEWESPAMTLTGRPRPDVTTETGVRARSTRVLRGVATWMVRLERLIWNFPSDSIIALRNPMS